jgi:putative oxidoreductase
MTQSHVPAVFDSIPARQTSKPLNIVAWVLQALLVLAFFAAGGAKLAGAPLMVAQFEKLGLGQWFRYFTGLCEVAGAIGLLIPRAVFYGATLLAIVMLGAIAVHLTVMGGNPAPPIVLLAMAATVAWIRRRRR